MRELSFNVNSLSFSLSLTLLEPNSKRKKKKERKERTKKKLKNHPQDPSLKEEIIIQRLYPLPIPLLYPNEIKIEEHLGEVESKVSEAPWRIFSMHQTTQLPRYKHRLNDTRLPLPEEGTSQLQYTPLSPFVLHRARIGICTVPRGAISKLRDPFTSSPRYSLPSPRFSPSLIVPLGVRFNRPSGRGSRHFRK